MLTSIDTWLNGISMDRLVRFVLIAYLAIAIGESLLGWLPYPALAISGSTALILAVA